MTLPTYITCLRIFLIPVIMAFILYDPASHMGRIIGFTLYVICGVSDFCDGWLARKFDLHSDLGRMLDPIADKLLIILLMITFIYTKDIHQPHIIAVFLIVAREFFIAGIREFLGSTNQILNVSYFAKWKTTLQILSVGFFMMHSVCPFNDFFVSSHMVANILLWLSCFLTLYTAAEYLKNMSTFLK